MSRVVVVGSGISGLFACLYLVNKGHTNITLIEQGSVLGGALKAFDYGEYGKFDHGMHNILLTNNPKIDELFHPFVMNDEWLPLEGNKRDLAGIFWKDKIQTETPYPQISRLENDDFASGIKDLLPRLGSTHSESTTCSEYFEKRFGKSLAKSVFEPIVEKIFKTKASDLHYTAASIVPLSRVSLEDNEFREVVLGSEQLRGTFAYPQQRNLPLKYSSGRSAYYPKNYGMFRLVDSIVEFLKSKGCEVLTNTKLASIQHSNGKVESVSLLRNNETYDVSVETLVWSAGQPPLMKALGLELNLPFQRAQKTYLANLVLKSQPKMDDLYYLYVYDPKFSTFRITNYQSYTVNCKRAGGYPVAVEMLSNEDLTSEQVVSKAFDELKALNLSAQEDFIWGKGEALTEGGFPLPSTVNVASLNDIRNAVSKLGLSNFLNTGIQSSPNTFFQTDVIIDTFAKLESKWK